MSTILPSASHTSDRVCASGGTYTNGFSLDDFFTPIEHYRYAAALSNVLSVMTEGDRTWTKNGCMVLVPASAQA